nr:hypothetical protein GCM10020185_04800 [Pseudomonas brassicacearum subsp. brassicacearum]
MVELDNDDLPNGLPAVHTDRHIYPNKSAAEQAAKARLAAFNRSSAGVRLEMAGRTDVFAERSIIVQGIKPGLDGEYLAEAVEQLFTSSGWTTAVECNGGKKGKANAKGKKKRRRKPSRSRSSSFKRTQQHPQTQPQPAIERDFLEPPCHSLSSNYSASCPTPAAKRAFFCIGPERRHGTPTDRYAQAAGGIPGPGWA